MRPESSKEVYTMSRIASWPMRLLVASALLALALPAFAASVQTGILTGTVTDNDGNPIPEATVIIQSKDGTITRTVLTIASGQFQSALLPPGAYTVVVQKEGYTAVAQDTTVLIDRTVTVLFSLQAGELTETVTVTSERPMVEKDNQEAAVQVDKSFAEELPVGRSYQNYAFFSPGVTGGSNPNINGGSSGDNRYLIDGVDTTDPTTNTFSLNLNYDSIEAVDVKTSGISAEYGNFQGGILNVITKSGGNDFEGYIRYGLTNRSWQAKYDEDNVGGAEGNSDEQRAINNPFEWVPRWSFNFGGPVVKDNAWFYINYDESNTLFQVGHVAEADTSSFGRFFNGQFTSFKFTWQMTANNKLTLQTTGDPADVSANYANPAEQYAWTLQNQGGNFYTLKWNSILTDTWYLDLNLANALNELKVQQLPPAAGCRMLAGGYSSCSVGPSSGFAPAYNLTNGRLADAAYFDGAVNRPRQQANLAVTKFLLDTGTGDHTFKFGADYQFTKSENGFSWPNDNLYLYLTGQVTGNSILDRDYYIWENVTVDEQFRVSVSEGTAYAGFFNDSWTLNENFSFNLGARVDYLTQEQELGDSVTDQTLVSPRLGATWDITGEAKHVLKLTAGRYIQALDLNTIDNFNIGGDARQATNTYINLNSRIFGGPGSVAAPNWVLAGVSGGGTLNRFFADDLQPGHVDEVTLGYEEAFTPTMSLAVRGIYRKWDNIIDDTGRFVDSGGLPVEQWFYDNNDDAEREYSALQLTFNKRFSKNYQVLVAYTWGEAKTNSTSSSGGGSSFQDYTQTPRARRIWETNRFGLAPWDRTHILKANGFYNVPLKSSKHQFTIGAEANFISGYAYSRLRDTFAQIPVQGGGYTTTADGTLYVDERGSYRWPDNYWIDLSLNYKYNLWKTTFETRLEIFNVTNVQDQNDGIDQDGDTFGNATGVGDYQDPRDYRLSFVLSW